MYDVNCYIISKNWVWKLSSLRLKVPWDSSLLQPNDRILVFKSPNGRWKPDKVKFVFWQVQTVKIIVSEERMTCLSISFSAYLYSVLVSLALSLLWKQRWIDLIDKSQFLLCKMLWSRSGKFVSLLLWLWQTSWSTPRHQSSSAVTFL